MDQKRLSSFAGTDVSVCVKCAVLLYILNFWIFTKFFFWYMVRLGIREIFLKHQYVPERRIAGTKFT